MDTKRTTPLGDYLRAALYEKRLTVREAAEVCGVGVTTMSQTLSGARHPSAPTVQQIAERLGLDVDKALRLAGIGRNAAPSTPSERAARAAQILSELPDNVQADLEAQILAVAERYRKT